MFCRLVNSYSGNPSEIIAKYLATGHTHMNADTIHGHMSHIEKCMRRKKDIYDLDDLVEVMRSSNKRNDVDVLSAHDFRDWRADNS